MIIGVASDHRGYKNKMKVIKYLKELIKINEKEKIFNRWYGHYLFFGFGT